MSARDQLIERNVARLLARAYVPIVPRPEFCEQVRRRVELALDARAARRAGAPLASSAAASAAQAELVRRPDSRAPRVETRSRWGWAVAAAVLLAIGLWTLVGQRGARSEREDLAAILARGAVALLEAGDWIELELVDGVARHGLTGVLEARTPAQAALVLAASAGDTLELAADSACALAPGVGPVVSLERGELVVSRVASQVAPARAPQAGSSAPWRIEFESHASARRAAIELASGRLRLAARRADACARAELSLDGRADLVADGWREALVAGAARELCADAFAAPAPDAGRTEVRGPGATSTSETEAVAPPLVVADLSGEVLDRASGLPLDDFTVVLAPRLTIPRPRDSKLHAFTAASGRFEIAEVEPGEYVVWIGRRGHAYYASGWLELGEEPATVRAELERGATVTGRVLEQTTGRPVEGARVFSESDVPASITELVLGPRYAGWVTIESSDAGGRFVLEHLRSAATRLRVTAPGFAPAWVSCDGEGEVEVRLVQGATLVGRVESGDGTPQAEHLLVAVPMDSSQYPLYWSQSLQTDEHGEFRAADLPAIQCVVVHIGARRDPASWARAPAVRYATLVAGEERRVDFVSRSRGARLFGRVLDPHGEPVGDRTLTVTPAGEGYEDPTRWRVTNVDAGGHYEVRGLAAGSYELFVSARAPEEVLYQATLTLAPDADLEHDVRLGAGTLRGRAVDARTRAPLGGVLWILMRREDGRESFAARIVGEPDGSFAVPNLKDGEYRLIALPQDGERAYGVLEDVTLAGGASLELPDLALEPGARAVVVVRTAEGAAVVGAEILVTDGLGRKLPLGDMQRTDPQGRLELRDLPAARVSLRARLGEVESREAVLDLAAGDAPTVDLLLDAR